MGLHAYLIIVGLLVGFGLVVIGKGLIEVGKAINRLQTRVVSLEWGLHDVELRIKRSQ